MAFVEKSLIKGKSQLTPANEAILNQTWTVRNGDEVYSTSTKHEVIRMTINDNQTVYDSMHFLERQPV